MSVIVQSSIKHSMQSYILKFWYYESKITDNQKLFYDRTILLRHITKTFLFYHC